MCATTDGAQGHAIGECVEELVVADAFPHVIFGALVILSSGIDNYCIALSIPEEFEKPAATLWRESYS